MKPILLATLEYPPQVGGVGEYLRRLVENMPSGAAVVLAPETDRAHEVDMVSEVPIYRRPLLSRWLRPRWLAALYWTEWLRRKEKPSALLVSHLLPMGQVARIVRRYSGLPYFVVVHGMDAGLALAAGGRKRHLAGEILREAEGVIANSDYTANLVAGGFGLSDRQISVIRPAPSLPLETAVSPVQAMEFRRRHGLPRSFLLLTVCRLVARKGFDTCLAAVAKLAKNGEPAHYVVVGDGPERSRLAALAEKLRIQDRVRFLGAVGREELELAYAASDAFVMVPRSFGPDVEGFGIVYLEAGLFGKPVIGARSGGVGDAVLDGRTGFLVPPDDTDALALAIRRLYAQPDDRELLGRCGRLRG